MRALESKLGYFCFQSKSSHQNRFVSWGLTARVESPGDYFSSPLYRHQSPASVFIYCRDGCSVMDNFWHYWQALYFSLPKKIIPTFNWCLWLLNCGWGRFSRRLITRINISPRAPDLFTAAGQFRRELFDTNQILLFRERGEKTTQASWGWKYWKSRRYISSSAIIIRILRK